MEDTEGEGEDGGECLKWRIMRAAASREAISHGGIACRTSAQLVKPGEKWSKRTSHRDDAGKDVVWTVLKREGCSDGKRRGVGVVVTVVLEQQG